MRIWKLTIALTVVLGLAVILAGCESDGVDGLTGSDQVGVDNYETLDFNQQFGGLSATDEEEAFGDPYLLALGLQEENEMSDDPLLVDPEVLAMEALAGEPEGPGEQRRPRFTFLRIAWGMLDGPVDELGQFDDRNDLLDWTGMLRVDRGIVVVRRVILFERPFDHLVYPRIDRKTVAWFSHTGNHYDGLLVQIIERPEDLANDLEPNMLHFVTGPYSNSFPVAELPELDQINRVDPSPNAIHFTGFRLTDITICPKGFLSGIWRSGDDSRGMFRGRWVGLFGHLHGFIRGGWGVNDEGERIFVGKYIGRRGNFLGYLRGHWEPVPELPGHGVFRGHWMREDESTVGCLGGRYFHLPERPAGGFFMGRWAVYCDNLAVETIE